MADQGHKAPNYEDLLRRAISELHADTPAERHKLYARARAAAAAQLGAMEPPASDRTVRAELERIDAAAERIEQTTPPPEPAAADEAYLDDVLERHPHPWLRRAWIGAGITLMLVLVGSGVALYGFFPSRPKEPAPPPSQAAEADAGLSYVFRTQPVYYRSTYPAGTVVVHKPQHFLYIVQGEQRAMRYGFAMGKDCAELAGVFRVTQKQEPLVAAPAAAPAPTFTSLVLHLSEEPGRIHPTPSPKAIGQVLGSGCIQLVTPGMVDLYGRVPVGARVVVGN